MTVGQERVLILGAGVIGSIYALKFIEAGIDVTILARGGRYRTLKENGIRYHEKGAVKTQAVKVIDTLDDDDIYGFIFVAVRYEQSEEALAALTSNQSKTIVTLINSSYGFSDWRDIVSDRLLPAFPAAGGQMKNGILHARIPPKALLATTAGEMGGAATERLERLGTLLKAAKLPLAIHKDMNAYLLTHSIVDISMIGALHIGDEIVDERTLGSGKTAREITRTMKTYLRALEKAGIVLTPPVFQKVKKCPDFILTIFFLFWLRSKMVRGMLVPEFANHAQKENLRLRGDIVKFLGENGVAL